MTTVMSPTDYKNASQWQQAAMARPNLISTQQCTARQQAADLHNKQHHISDADNLADQQLYIQGKMDIKEYQNYLLFKHSKP